MKRLFSVFGAGCLFAGLTLSAATLTVDRNGGDGVFRTIGEAAAKAAPGDVVLVRPGVYREHVAPERGGEAGRRSLSGPKSPARFSSAAARCGSRC